MFQTQCVCCDVVNETLNKIKLNFVLKGINFCLLFVREYYCAVMLA
jgi:hypothetical protein